MTDLFELSYYDTGLSQWVNVADYVTDFTVEEMGIQRASALRYTVHGNYSAFDALLNGHHKQMRALIKPEGAIDYYRVFYGWIWEPKADLETGSSTKITLPLDCRSITQRLADDTVTVDYYSMQAASSPKTVITYADTDTSMGVIDDFLLTPDSGFDTGFLLDAPSGGNIHNAVDRTCNFDRQTLLDAIRVICDRCGYDGWTDIDVEQKKLYLRPFGYGSSVATLTQPFLACSWSRGSLDDIVNYVLVHGGTDEGTPSDGDRWTEYGYTKYTSTPWSATISSGTIVVSDVDNTNFVKNGVDYGVNDKAIRAEATTVNNISIEFKLDLDLTKTNELKADCLERCTELSFFFYPFTNDTQSTFQHLTLTIGLVDNSANEIRYKCEGINGVWFDPAQLQKIRISLGKTNAIGTRKDFLQKWYYEVGSTFDWKNVVKVRFIVTNQRFNSGTVWGCEIDGLQFLGGFPIDPFAEYAGTYNLYQYNQTSIDTYGVHVLHHQDTVISSFEHAAKEGERVLTNLKDPIAKLEIKIPALITRILPSNLVTVTIPQLGINAETWRVIPPVRYEWNANRKTIHQTLTLTKSTTPLPPLWSEQPELRSFVK